MNKNKSMEATAVTNPHRVFLESSFIYLPDSVQAILIAGNMLVLIIAICGNIAAITVVVKARLSKLSTKLFLATLAISDLALVIFSVPIELGKLTDKYHSWVLGKFLCETVASIQTHVVLMNAICLFGIAFERYLSVIRSPKLSSISPLWETRIPYLILALTWLIPFGISIPMLWAYEELSFWVLTFNATGHVVRLTNDTNYLCQSNDDFLMRVEMFTVLGIIYFVLLLGFILCYGSIIRFVQNRGVKFVPVNLTSSDNTKICTSNETGVETNSSFSTTGTTVKSALPSALASPKKLHRRTVRLIMTLILIFFICRSPIMIFNLVLNIKLTKKSVTNTCIMYFLHLLSNVSTVLSPFVYAIWNNSLRSPPTVVDPGYGKTSNGCCCFKNGGGRMSNGKTIFTNTSSIANIFKFRQNSFSFNSQSKIYPSNSTFTQKFVVIDKNEFVSRTSTPTVPTAPMAANITFT